MFSAVMVLFCLSALLPASADAGSLVFDKMLFYESGYNGVEYPQRVYANRFPKSTTRHINGEVNFVNYANTDEAHKLLLKYYKSDGTLFGETTGGGVIKSKYEWATTWIPAGLGWDAPNNWPVGQYRVEAYLDGVYVATNYFEVYDDKIASVSQDNLVKYDIYGEKNGNKTYDLYYDKKITKTSYGTVFIAIGNVYTAYGKEVRIKDTPGFPLNAVASIYSLEIDVNLSKYSVWTIIYIDSNGNIISENKYDNPPWVDAAKGTMSEHYVKIAKKLLGINF